MDVVKGDGVKVDFFVLEKGIGDFCKIKIFIVVNDPAEPVPTEML
tara:strand:+ start:26560 stop:26694 length:135 start_codon:yes stop_codon:yes gene_type:complete